MHPYKQSGWWQDVQLDAAHPASNQTAYMDA